MPTCALEFHASKATLYRHLRVLVHHGEIVRILALSDVKERISGFGAEIITTTPEEFDQFNREQIAQWAKVVKFSGARPD